MDEEKKRRPRGNYIVCDGKYWVSWGPRAPLPDTRTGVDVLVPVDSEDPKSDWRNAGGTEGVVSHPDYPALTLDQALEVIDGLCAVLSQYTRVWPPKG